MSELRKEVLECIDQIPDTKLEALKPILLLLVNDSPIVENVLTEEEQAIIRAGRKEYKQGGFVPLSSIN